MIVRGLNQQKLFLSENLSKQLEQQNVQKHEEFRNLKVIHSVLNRVRADVKFNSSVDMEILVFFVVKILALKISSVDKGRQFSLSLDFVVSRNRKKLSFKM